MGYLLLFQSRGLMRAQDFADQFEISERTVYRDIQALSEVGVPIMAMPGEGYRLMDGYYLPPIVFTPEEARALSLAVSMMTGLTEDSPTKEYAGIALDKIRAVLPETKQGFFGNQATFGIFKPDIFYKGPSGRVCHEINKTLPQGSHVRHMILDLYFVVIHFDLFCGCQPYRLSSADNCPQAADMSEPLLSRVITV